MTLAVLLGNPVMLFVLLIIGGETALIPAVYFAHIGAVNYFFIIPLTLLATLIADTGWYFLGRCVKKETVTSHKWSKNYHKKIQRFSQYFERNSMKFLLISKFIYGTRTAAQLLCGIHKVSFAKYALFNAIGVIALLFFLLGLAPLVTNSVESLTDTVYTIQISFAIFLAISFGAFFLLKYLGYKRLTD